MSKPEFKNLQILPEILKALHDMGFQNPSPIQQEAIPHLIQGKDLIGQAQTGTGKTAAFAIPIVQRIDFKDKHLSAVILCPTRELVIQVAEEFRKILKYRPGLQVVSVYGGQEIGKQFAALKKNPQIVVGTPGRLMDHMRRKTIKMSDVKAVVLDEADEMLDMGFRDDMEIILKEAPADRQTIMFSATMTDDIRNLMKKYLKSPVMVNAGTMKDRKDPDITQYFAVVPEKKRTEAIIRLVEYYSLAQSLVFCNTKAQVDDMAEHLRKRGIAAGALHGDLNQNQRDKVMGAFRTGMVRILVATDVAGRGIDVGNIEAVFNLDLPRDEEDYVHRIGRTGRAGRSGKAFSFVGQGGISRVYRISKKLGKEIQHCKIPEAAELEQRKLENLLPKIKSVSSAGGIEKYKPVIKKLADEGFEPSIAAAALLCLMQLRESEMYQPQIQFTEENKLSQPQSGDSRDRGGFNQRSRRPKRHFHRKNGRGGGGKKR